MMTEGWIKIYSAPDLLEVKLAEDILKQHGIESHIVSRPDSAIPSLGEASLYSPADKAEEAVAILREHQIKI
ncbi:MAG: DUF2007 domain-containing protein [Lewinellaceae bacterium]|nr:DUF2007 domain-containing protein [Lewinellaceae bacterium]